MDKKSNKEKATFIIYVFICFSEILLFYYQNCNVVVSSPIPPSSTTQINDIKLTTKTNK